MKADAYQVITDRIIGLLERGVIPWQKPWQSGQTAKKPNQQKRVSRRERVLASRDDVRKPVLAYVQSSQGTGGTHQARRESFPRRVLEMAGSGRRGQTHGQENGALPALLLGF